MHHRVGAGQSIPSASAKSTSQSTGWTRPRSRTQPWCNSRPQHPILSRRKPRSFANSSPSSGSTMRSVSHRPFARRRERWRSPQPVQPCMRLPFAAETGGDRKPRDKKAPGVAAARRLPGAFHSVRTRRPDCAARQQRPVFIIASRRHARPDETDLRPQRRRHRRHRRRRHRRSTACHFRRRQAARRTWRAMRSGHAPARRMPGST